MQIRLITISAALAMLTCTNLVHAADAMDLKDPKQKLSYSIGAQIGGGLKQQGLDIDPTAFTAGLTDVLAGKLAMSETEMQQVLEAARAELVAKQQAKQKVNATENTKSGEAFLAANAKKDGVKKTVSGLQYKVLKAGTGRTPGQKDTVKVHYQGTLIDGTVFDSSIARAEPVVFPVGGVIAGWTEALQLMQEGAKYQLVIPPNLAYGAAGAGDKIGPNSVLIFDVELISIEK